MYWKSEKMNKPVTGNMLTYTTKYRANLLWNKFVNSLIWPSPKRSVLRNLTII